MRFLHCDQCGQATRLLPGGFEDEEAAQFRRIHATCRLHTYEATGRSVASGAWDDPMSRRQFEIRGASGFALAVGERSHLDEPLGWRIEATPPREETTVELDRTLFWSAVDRALSPHHIPRRPLEEWASQLEHFARAARPADIVVLEDDPASGDASYACLTMTASTRLEAALAAFGFDPVTEERLRALFEDELFPPLRVRRRLVTPDGPPPADRAPEPSLTR